MQNKEIDALRSLIHQEIYDYFVGGDIPREAYSFEEDHLELLARIDGCIEDKKTTTMIAEIEAAAVDVAINDTHYLTVSQAPDSKYAKGWNDCLRNQEKWAANRRKGAQG